MFNGKHRVNVEEKKPKEELVARPRSASHLAGKSSAGRGMDSNMVGPRGGGGRQNVAPGGPRNYAKAAVNDEGKPGTRWLPQNSIIWWYTRLNWSFCDIL